MAILELQHKNVLGEVKVLIQTIVLLLYISDAIEASFLKFSMFNIPQNTISNMFLVFSNFKIVSSCTG